MHCKYIVVSLLVGLYVLQHIKGVADVDICDNPMCKLRKFSFVFGHLWGKR